MFYGAMVWDPWLIVSQIVCLQCLYYLALGLSMALLVGTRVPRLTLLYFFDFATLTPRTPTGWCAIASFLLAAVAGYAAAPYSRSPSSCLICDWNGFFCEDSERHVAIYTCPARVLLGANRFWLRELRLLGSKLCGVCVSRSARLGQAQQLRSVNLRELVGISWGTS